MPPPSDVRKLFLEEARRRGVEVRRTLSDGRIVVAVDGYELTVSLENLTRDVVRDGDLDSVRRFVETLRRSGEDLPPWPAARGGLRYSLEPSHSDFGETIHRPVTDVVSQVVVYVDPEERRITWLTPAALAVWDLPPAEMEAAADANMAALLAGAPLRIERIDRHRLGLLESPSVFKASLLLAPNLRQVVEPALGWPVFAVLPCRDFLYLIPAEDEELLPRLGSVVVREYRESGYPITTEVWEIGDSGIQAIGAFDPEGAP